MRNALKALLICTVMAIVWSNTGLVAAPSVRAFVAGRFMLEIDGNEVGFVNAVEGGLAFGDVVKVAGEDFFQEAHRQPWLPRHPAGSRRRSVDKSFYSSIALALQGQHVSLNGAILSDFNYNVVSRLEFQQALITEVGFPALDATSKDSARGLSIGSCRRTRDGSESENLGQSQRRKRSEQPEEEVVDLNFQVLDRWDRHQEGLENRRADDQTPAAKRRRPHRVSPLRQFSAERSVEDRFSSRRRDDRRAC